jgi:DNA repair protein RadC
MGEHDGHRKRILQKLDSGVLLEHELLEVLLFNAIPRRNTNDIAHRLLAKFGSILDIFNASFAELKRVDGVGESVASYLFCIGKFYKAYYESQERDSYPDSFDTEVFISYVKREYKKLQKEVLDAYLLDANGKLIVKKRFSADNYFTAELSPEELIQFFYEYTPSGLVLVHNHPYGVPEPSQMDDETTAKCQLICSSQNILFCDHIIYAPNGIYSYYLSGKMREITKSCSLQKLLKGALDKGVEE